MTQLLTLLFLANTCWATGLKVAETSGNVRLNGQAAKKNDALPAGGLIEVGSGDRDHIDLVYLEGHRLRLKKNSKFRWSGDTPKGPTVLELLSGKLYAFMVKGHGADKIEFRTRAVIAGVRGTKFMIEEDTAKGSYFCVCDGSVHVEAKGFTAQDVKAGEDLWALPGKPIEAPKDSPGMAKMTNDEFTAMGL